MKIKTENIPQLQTRSKHFKSVFVDKHVYSRVYSHQLHNDGGKKTLSGNLFTIV